MTSGFIRTASDIDLETGTATQRKSTEPAEKPASPFRPQGATTSSNATLAPLEIATRSIIIVDGAPELWNSGGWGATK
jgi:hypothetical protein